MDDDSDENDEDDEEENREEPAIKRQQTDVRYKYL
jgi:hypothetical protein